MLQVTSTARMFRTRKRAHIDSSLTIVNVVLLLLLFFVVTGNISGNADKSTTLARTALLPLETLPEPLLRIHADGAMALRGADIAPSNLTAEDPVLHVMADAGMPAIELLSLLRREVPEGVRLLLVTRHDDQVAP